MNNSKKILIVEDDIDLRNMYKHRLEMEGYKVYEANDGGEGLDKIDKVSPDLVILDLLMPNVSGVEFLAVIKETPETAKIPIIVLTAYLVEKPRVDHYDIEGFLVKSESSLEEVVKKVNQILKST